MRNAKLQGECTNVVERIRRMGHLARPEGHKGYGWQGLRAIKGTAGKA
ncbi:MAG: hypothetical protein HFH92_04725 [Lachnospiraceae bacterium]|nr:hypothetical protein [uncultured Acetatifactor sp.]MCI8788406.1 hypothetical protein [Lachnospiraceae bacterium]